MDSLGAVELRNAISSHFCVEVPATLAFDYPTETALVSFIVSKLEFSQSKAANRQIQTFRDEPSSLHLTSEVLAVSCRYPKRVDGESLCSESCSFLCTCLSRHFIPLWMC